MLQAAISDSLPLMGIGNLAGTSHNLGLPDLITPHGDRKHIKYLGALAVVAALSLPLMGIGNVLSTGSKSRTHVSSLPLMGIGNPDGRVLGAHLVGHLITPHGDRNAGRTAPVEDAEYELEASLPLMGIGNGTRVATKGSQWSSLPLMGIGN